jgi:Leucine-rich repeat (LRR) protein
MTSNKNFLEPLRPPDPRLFIRAGTSGVRHLFPIHLNNTDCNDSLFSRSISRLRSRTPTTALCTNIEMIRNICSSIRTLEHFDISGNDLNNLPSDICLLIHLETLNCSHNQLTNLSDLLEDLKQLKELDLSFNQFKRIPNVIYSFKYLIRFNCEHNFLKILDTNIVNLKHLKILILDHNQFQSFHTLDFSQMKRLEYLHIAHNQLIKFPFNLHKLTHLKNLNLSHNNLTYFPIELLLINTLDVLNLSHNSIEKLSPLTDAYKRTTLIFSIDLSFNQLTKFYDYLLLISLKLDLSNNQIQSIPHDLLRKLPKEMITNRELKIMNNPLIQPSIPSELLDNQINILHLIRNCFDEQYNDETVRQGFKISITGCKKSGKSSLAYCLEEHMPLIPEENSERIVNSK